MDQQVSPHTLRTSSLTVTAKAIQTYAALTNDFNPLHVDADFAANTPMGRQIAHGTMSLCLIWQSVQRTFGGDALAGIELDVRFVKPIHIGDTVTAGGNASTDEPGRWDVWVRGDEGVDRIVGVFRLADESNSNQGDSNGCC